MKKFSMKASQKSRDRRDQKTSHFSPGADYIEGSYLKWQKGLRRKLSCQLTQNGV
jgi:hypothetical protein